MNGFEALEDSAVLLPCTLLLTLTSVSLEGVVMSLKRGAHLVNRR